jgi:serine/threonine protein kinase
MSSAGPPLGYIGRGAGDAWVQPPSAIALSQEVTIHIPEPQPPGLVVRRPKVLVAPSADPSGGLGAGLVDVPVLSGRDPADAVLSNPLVPERKRFCANCQSPVGRGEHGAPGRAEGFCPNCGTPFSFTPALRTGEVIGRRYEVLGVIAYGGWGWIYLGQDLDAGDRWVVLKGLINVGDPVAVAAAANEVRVLTEVDHRNIVKVYDVVEHTNPRTGASTGYIVMEYLSGLSLREIALVHQRETGRPEPLPVSQVIAYGLEILSALGYLHRRGLLYCDLKPDNVIQSGDRIKLIDFGGVRRMDDDQSPIFFTHGYAAPEIAAEGPSVAADLYTVGRTLAVLSFDFTGYTSRYQYALPEPDDVPLLDRFDSYRRFLERATDSDTDRRFDSAEQMAEQLTGVLREILALETGEPKPGKSAVFGPEASGFGQLVVHDGTLSVLPPAVSEIVHGLPIAQRDTPDWDSGLGSLTADRPEDARRWFDQVYSEFPGELAPKLALAASAELAGDWVAAGRYYERVWVTDRSYLSAAFGLARALLAQGDPEGADAVIHAVPTNQPPTPADGGHRTRRDRRMRWWTFVNGLAQALIPVPEPRRRARHRTAWERIEARLHETYSRLGPPAPTRKDAQR